MNKKQEQQISVLLVDDEVEFTRMLSKRLETRGFQVETTNCGESAMNMLRDKSFDVMILDLSMPGMDGIETLRQTKKENEHIQVIMLTGHGTIEKSVAAIKEGATDFLEKPIDIGELSDRIRSAFDTKNRRITDQRLAHTEKLAFLGTLAAGVAHELNNPLTIILGMTDLLFEKVDTGTETYEILKTIERQGHNAKRIVENLVAFARASGAADEDIDVNTVIHEIITIVGKTLTINNVKLNCRLCEEVPLVHGNHGEFQQVFVNIINNALHEMKNGGVITIRSRAINDGKTVELTFSDTGAGIRKLHRDKIFDPFFTTKKVGEGTGLGLSISYGIIKKYGGTITFDTKTKHESTSTGTTFTIRLPAAPTRPLAGPHQKQAI